LNWDEFKAHSLKTLMYKSDKEKIACSALEIIDEVNEYIEAKLKVKDIWNITKIEDMTNLKKELGDILYPIAILDDHYNLMLEVKVNSEYDIREHTGTVAGIMKKTIRDDNYILTNTKDRRMRLWGTLSAIIKFVDEEARFLDSNLSDIMSMNVEKLQSRMARGKIKGDGDNR